MGSYDAPHQLEELQLLGQMRSWPVRIRHSSTRTIAARLVDAGEAMIGDTATPGDTLLDLTSDGRARLLADQAARGVKRCPFCDTRLVGSVGSITLMHPHGSDCILRNFATSDVDGWNRRAGEDVNG